MFYKAPDQYINEGQPFTIDGTQYPSNWLNLSSAEDKAALGLVEVTTVGTRGDDRYEWVSETLEGAVRTIVNTPKDPEMVKATKNAAVLAEITALEQSQLMPRATREFMLMFMEANAPAEVLAVNPGYKAVKAFDKVLTDKRKELLP